MKFDELVDPVAVSKNSKFKLCALYNFFVIGIQN
jgi:hypothetical protein